MYSIESAIWRGLGLVVVVVGLAACAAQPSARTTAATTAVMITPTAAAETGAITLAPTSSELMVETMPAATPSVVPTIEEKKPDPQDWENWPVIPSISERTIEIYQNGMTKGNNPRAFSKIGDCESITEWFLADFDKGSKFYKLGPYQDLQQVIDYYSGSFGRLGVAARPGFTAASVMNTFWRDPEKCKKNETPLGCEYRLQRPSLALVMLGTNDVSRPETFEKNMRKVIESSIEQGVVPVLTTKADNLEGDFSVNKTVVRLAAEYDIPLWNFWRAVQPLPSHGLQADKTHLTFLENTFDDPVVLERAWPVRNLTALQVLDAIMKATSQK